MLTFMLIAVVNQKGGVGKTTLAVHLAAWLRESGRRVAFIDADGQSSSSRWLRVAEPTIELMAETHADAIIEHGTDLRCRFDVVIADGPANLAESTRALLLVADLAVIPCGATMPELESTADTVRILRNVQAVRPESRPAGLLVLTRLRNDRYQLTREAPAAAKTLGIPISSYVVRLRESIADAPGQRTLVWRLGRNGRTAACEMKRVMTEIMNHADPQTDYASSLDERPGSLPASVENAFESSIKRNGPPNA